MNDLVPWIAIPILVAVFLYGWSGRKEADGYEENKK